MTAGFYPAAESKPLNFFEISKGNVPGHRIFTVLSQKAGLTTKADIWDVAGSLVYPTGAETLEIITTGNDTAAGTGAQEVTIEYLDTSYVTQTATAATNAGTQAITTVNFFRLQRMIVSAVGTGGENENDIDIQVTGGVNIRGRMLAGNNRTLASFFTVPAGEIAIPALLYSDSKKNDDADLTFVSTIGTAGIFYPIFLASVYQNSTALNADVAAQIDEKSDVKVFGESQVSSKVAASVQFILIDKALVNLA